MYVDALKIDTLEFFNFWQIKKKTGKKFSWNLNWITWVPKELLSPHLVQSLFYAKFITSNLFRFFKVVHVGQKLKKLIFCHYQLGVCRFWYSRNGSGCVTLIYWKWCSTSFSTPDSWNFPLNSNSSPSPICGVPHTLSLTNFGEFITNLFQKLLKCKIK